MGIVAFGDENVANFEIPEKYLVPEGWKSDTFIDLWWKVHDDGLTPQKSFVTGYITDPEFKSLHKKLIGHNRCNRNDYQNYGVRKANSQNYLNIVKNMRRNSTTDFPVLIVYQLGQNDICNSIPGNQTVTDLKDFQKKTIEIWKNIDN